MLNSTEKKTTTKKKQPSSKDSVKRKERSPRVGAPLANSPLLASLAPTSGPVSPSLAPMPPPRA